MSNQIKTWDDVYAFMLERLGSGGVVLLQEMATPLWILAVLVGTLIFIEMSRWPAGRYIKTNRAEAYGFVFVVVIVCWALFVVSD